MTLKVDVTSCACAQTKAREESIVKNGKCDGMNNLQGCYVAVGAGNMGPTKARRHHMVVPIRNVVARVIQRPAQLN